MKCRICRKDITSIYFFTKKPYCSKECEKKDETYSEGEDIFKKLFK